MIISTIILLFLLLNFKDKFYIYVVNDENTIRCVIFPYLHIFKLHRNYWKSIRYFYFKI